MSQCQSSDGLGTRNLEFWVLEVVQLLSDNSFLYII